MVNIDFFLGEIIIESLATRSSLDSIEEFLVKKRTEERSAEKTPRWHIHRYRLPREWPITIAPVLEQSFDSGEWYIHFFSEAHDELFVIMKGRTFQLPKIRTPAWDRMISYGESVGVGRRWTQSIPVKLPE